MNATEPEVWEEHYDESPEDFFMDPIAEALDHIETYGDGPCGFDDCDVCV